MKVRIAKWFLPKYLVWLDGGWPFLHVRIGTRVHDRDRLTYRFTNASMKE